MIRKLQELSPNARILNEIMVFLFTPEAATSKGVAPDQISAVLAQFSNAPKLEVQTVKRLLSKFVDELDKLERQIELREIEDSAQSFKVRLKAQEARMRTKEFTRDEQLTCESQENLHKWLVTDPETVLKKIESKELLTLPDFIRSRGVSKRSVKTAMTWGRMFCITGPDGVDYYPAFFADSNDYIRQCLGKVCQVLGNIPSYAKYQFLTTDFHCLATGETPMQAIRSGRVDDVLQLIKWLLLPQ